MTPTLTAEHSPTPPTPDDTEISPAEPNELGETRQAAQDFVDRLSRSEHKKLFYDQLGRKILSSAGVDISYLPDLPAEITIVPLEPRSRRQGKDEAKSYAATKEFKKASNTLNDYIYLREGIDAGTRNGQLNRKIVHKSDIRPARKMLKKQLKRGEISHFEYAKAKDHLRHAASSHGRIRSRELTPEEMEHTRQPHAKEKKALKKFRKHREAAIRLRQKGEPNKLTSAVNHLRHRNIANWRSKLDIDKVIDLRARIENAAIAEVGKQMDEAASGHRTFVDAETALPSIKHRILEAMLPEYLQIDKEDLGSVPNKHKKQLLDLLFNKTWEQLDKLQDKKAGTIRKRQNGEDFKGRARQAADWGDRFAANLGDRLYNQRGRAEQPTYEKPEPRLGRALWHAPDGDMEVEIEGYLGDYEGKEYVSIAGSETVIPLSQITFQENESDREKLHVGPAVWHSPSGDVEIRVGDWHIGPRRGRSYVEAWDGDGNLVGNIPFEQISYPDDETKSETDDEAES